MSGTRNAGRGTRLLASAVLITATATDLWCQNPPTTIVPPAQQPAPQRGGGNRGRGGIRIMTLTSPAFADGGMIPTKHAQPGRDVSPALSWTGAPDSVASYVLLVHDADAAGGDGTDDVMHWLVWNIPGSATGLPEGVRQGPQVAGVVPAPAAPPGPGGGGGGGLAAGIRQISVSGPYYRGPAAPNTGPAHHYVFELYALDANVNVQPVIQNAGLTRRLVMEAIENHVRGKGVLVGLFRRADPPQP
jgi:Raf kinase inhibitor-like YbhB/YbcL family protein